MKGRKLKGAPVEKSEYPILQRSYARLVLYLYGNFREKAPDLLNAATAKILKPLRNHGAGQYLDSLRETGCDVELILWLLHCCHDSAQLFSVKKLAGLDPREFRKARKNINQLAHEIREINQHHFGMFLMHDELLFFQQLPNALARYAELLGQTARDHGRGQGHLSVVKALIVDHVRSRTCAYHDSEVANLVAAALNLETHDRPSVVCQRKLYRDTNNRISCRCPRLPCILRILSQVNVRASSSRLLKGLGKSKCHSLTAHTMFLFSY